MSINLRHLGDASLRLATAARILNGDCGEAFFEWLEAQGLQMAAPPQLQRGSALAVVRALILHPPPAAHWPVLLQGAQERGRMDLMELFRLPEEPGEAGSRPALDRELLEMGVGRRIALARLAPINMMERLVLDNEPRVIAALLRSPRVRRQEVLRMTTRRPLPLAVAREVLLSHRWSAEYPVLRSLARNETLLDRWGAALTLLLTPKDLSELAADPKASLARRRIARFRSLASHGALPEKDEPQIRVIELDPAAADD